MEQNRGMQNNQQMHISVHVLQTDRLMGKQQRYLQFTESDFKSYHLVIDYLHMKKADLNSSLNKNNKYNSDSHALQSISL